MRTATVNMLWVGKQLGRLEQLSAASFVHNGHHVRLYAYSELLGVPDGVEVCDANAVVPFERIQWLRHQKTGSFALASDYFRYKLQLLEAGLWSDMDVVCLRPVPIDETLICGMEDARYVNGAILFIGPNHRDLILRAISVMENPGVPPWLKTKDRIGAVAKAWLGRPAGPHDLPWGSFGPRMLTYMIRKAGLMAMVKHPSIFYPVHWKQAADLYKPGISLRDLVRESSLTLHVWNEALGSIPRNSPHPDSPIGQLMSLYRV